MHNIERGTGMPASHNKAFARMSICLKLRMMRGGIKNPE
jgi:hypothetical protein